MDITIRVREKPIHMNIIDTCDLPDSLYVYIGQITSTHVITIAYKKLAFHYDFPTMGIVAFSRINFGISITVGAKPMKDPVKSEVFILLVSFITDHENVTKFAFSQNIHHKRI